MTIKGGVAPCIFYTGRTNSSIERKDYWMIEEFVWMIRKGWPEYKNADLDTLLDFTDAEYYEICPEHVLEREVLLKQLEKKKMQRENRFMGGKSNGSCCIS